MFSRLSWCTFVGASTVIGAVAGAQTPAPTPVAPTQHPAVCAAAVRVYHQKSDIPAPYDTVALPPGPPVRVTSPEEAEAAELDMRERAGAAGANGVLIAEETIDQGDGNVRMRRSVTAIYAPSDSARAATVCRKP